MFKTRNTSVGKCYPSVYRRDSMKIVVANTEYVNSKTVCKQPAAGLRDWFYFSPGGFISFVPEIAFICDHSPYSFLSTHPFTPRDQDEFQRDVKLSVASRDVYSKLLTDNYSFPFSTDPVSRQRCFYLVYRRNVQTECEITTISDAITQKLAVTPTNDVTKQTTNFLSLRYSKRVYVFRVSTAWHWIV